MPSNHHPYSPSVLCRRSHCPASRRIEDGIEDQPSEAAESGTRIHEAVAKWIRSGRDDDFGVALEDTVEQSLYEDCCEWLQARVGRGIHVEAERPLVLRDIYGGVLTTGTADVVYQDADLRWHVVDWKTGRGEIDPAEGNWQGAAYAAMLAQEKTVNSAAVTFFQPALKRETSHEFDYFQLQEIYKRIVECVEYGESKNPRREAGSWCQYCKGRLAGACNLYRYKVEESLLVPPEYEVGKMAEDVLAREYERARVAAEYADALKAEIQRRCRERGEACGYTLKPKQGARTIGDAQAAFERLSGMLGQADFLQCVSVSPGDLERRYWEAQRAARPADKITLKQAKQDLENALGDVVRRKPETFTLTPIKEAKK